MTVKEALKYNSEKIFSDITGKQIIVDFIPDVLKAQKEICKNDAKKFVKVYSAEHFTGMFIPNSENHCAYILAEANRNDVESVITVGHEFQHALDYYLLLLLYDNNQEKMINSDLYYTFQIYSEFNAEQRGIRMFFDLCLVDKTVQEKVKIIQETYMSVYDDFTCVNNKFEFIIHSIQYIGILYACASYWDKFDIEKYMSEMNSILDLKEIILELFSRHKFDLIWLQKFDKICRNVMEI